jgi:hypothetical protein
MKKKYFKLLWVLSFLLLLTLLVFAGVTYSKNTLSETFDWYYEAAEQGLPEAQFYIGNMYYEGDMIPKDYNKAVKWFRMAAEQGFPNAQFKMGVMYGLGLGGLHSSRSEAIKWYRKAAEQGNPEGQYWLANNINYGNNNKEEALKWYRKSAERGYLRAQIAMGDYYNCSYCDYDVNHSEAAKWYLLAAEQGSGYAQHKLGQKYFKGLGVSQDYEEAAKWYKKAFEQGDTNASHKLGIMYEKGIGVPVDYVKAHVCYHLSYNLSSKAFLSLVEKMTDGEKQKALAMAAQLGKRLKLQEKILGPYEDRSW